MKVKFNFIKRNQVVVAVIGLMFIAAGYLNFMNQEKINQSLETGTLMDSVDMAEIGDAQLVSTQPANDSNLLEENTVLSGTEGKNTQGENNIVVDTDKTEAENAMNTVTESSTQATNADVSADEYFTKSRLDRDTMYSQMIESYQKILEKTTISESQRGTAQKEIIKINEQKNAIMITENLMKTKGFEDLIIFINDKSVNVIVKAKKLETEQIAQIQNIITRELNTKIENIHISTKEK